MRVTSGDDFTNLLYIAVTSSVFLYKLPIREGGALDISHPTPPTLTLPAPSMSVTLPACGVGAW